MLVSFIIPVYNTNYKVLRRCINSILKIKNIEYEILLIDDGSQSAFSNKYKEIKCNNIKYYYQINKGVSAARNNGIKKSQGKYICFVDSDDIILAESINTDLFKNEYDIIVYDLKYVVKNNESIKKEIVGESGTINVNSVIKCFLESRSFHSPCSKFYKKSTILDNDIFFNSRLIQSEDAIFNLDLLNINPSIYYYNKPLAVYYFDYNTSNIRWENNTKKMFDNLSYYYKRKMNLCNNFDSKEKMFYNNIVYSTLISDLFSLCLQFNKNKNITKLCKLTLLDFYDKSFKESIKTTTKRIIIMNNCSFVLNFINKFRLFYLKYIKKRY